MRKLVLQMQVSADGYVGTASRGPNGRYRTGARIARGTTASSASSIVEHDWSKVFSAPTDAERGLVRSVITFARVVQSK
jgi:hypothetical protein